MLDDGASLATMSIYSEKFYIKPSKKRLPCPWSLTSSGHGWHHIIPFSLLKGVWNILCDRYVDSAEAAARTAIRQYLSTLNSRIEGVDDLVDRMRAETGQSIAKHNPLKPLSYVEILSMHSAVTYPAWGLVEGPTTRPGDPENEFDRFEIGLTPQEVGRMAVLKKLFEKLREFEGSPHPPLDSLIGAIRVAAIDLRHVVEPIHFRRNMWVEDGSGWKKAV